MGYCRQIDGECKASNNALKCAQTECPKEKPDAAKKDRHT